MAGMEFPNDLVTLMGNLQRFVMTGAALLPEHTQTAVLAAAGHPSPVDRLVKTAEALYAAKDELTADGIVISAQLAQFAAVNGFHGMTDRGLLIAQALQRIAGFDAPVGTTWPAPEDDPEPLGEYLPAEEEAEVPVE